MRTYVCRPCDEWVDEDSGVTPWQVLHDAQEEKEVFERVKKVVVAQLGVAPESVTMAASFTKDLGADPVAVIELEFALEEEFGIEIPDVDRQKITTVGEAISYISAVGWGEAEAGAPFRAYWRRRACTAPVCAADAHVCRKMRTRLRPLPRSGVIS